MADAPPSAEPQQQAPAAPTTASGTDAAPPASATAAPAAAAAAAADVKAPAAAPTPSVAAAVSKPESPATVNIVAKEQAPPPADSKPQEAKPEAKKDTAPAQSKPAETAAKSTNQPDDDFYKTIFYFSGMGTVIGAALAEGVYVGEKSRRCAIDADEVDAKRGQRGTAGGRKDDLVVTARGQAQNLSTDFHQLQSLLDSMPIYTSTGELPGRDASGGLDQPIHGELYFSRCKERFPVQQPTRSAADPQSMSMEDGLAAVSAGEAARREERRRRNYEDTVLADVARAAVEAFPMMPTPQALQVAARSSRESSAARSRVSPSPVPGGRTRPVSRPTEVRVYENGGYAY